MAEMAAANLLAGVAEPRQRIPTPVNPEVYDQG
jgi:hypothetical protein